MAALISKEIFGQPGSTQIKIDPTGLSLPTMTVGLVYAIDSSKDIIQSIASSVNLLGVFVGTNDAGFLLFEQGVYNEEATFTSAGTIWYLTAAGALTSTPGNVQFGIAIDADNLLIAAVGDAVTGPDGTTQVDQNSVTVLAATSAVILDFISDVAGAKPFADVSDGGGGIAVIEIDKQINFDDLAGGVGPVATGFSFDKTVYRSCEIFYVISSEGGGWETGSIYLLHDDSAGSISIVPTTIGVAAGVTFTVDISGNDCRLLYTQAGGDDFNLMVKPRAMVINEFGGGGD